AVRLAVSVRVSHMAGRVAADGALSTMLTRLERDGLGAGRAAFTIGTHLAEECLLQGCYDDGVQRLLMLVDRGRRQRRDTMRMMLLFRPLIVALTELDRSDQAREVVVEAMPLVRWFDWRWSYAPVLAFLAARRGRPDTAARLLAAGEARRARFGGRLDLIE